MNVLTSRAANSGRDQNALMETALLVALQLSLALMLFKLSKAGYYGSSEYEFFAQNGYASTKTLAIDPDNNNPFGFIGTAYSIVAVVLLIILRPSRPRAQYVVLLVIYAYIEFTALWSDVLYETSYNLIVSGLAVFILMSIIDRLPISRIYYAFFALTALVCLISIYLSSTQSAFRVSLGTTGWRGSFYHKNGLAAFCMFGLIFLLPFITSRRYRMTAGAMVAILFSLTILSEGKTALYVSIAYAIVATALRLIQRSNEKLFAFIYKIVFPFLIASIVAIVPLVAFWSDAAFTGRARLWRFFLQGIDYNLIYGFGGLSLKSDPAIALAAMQAVGIPEPDSSIVLMIFNQGIIGILLYLFLLFYLLQKCIRSSSPFAPYASASILSYVAYGCMESDASLVASLGLVIILLLVEFTQNKIGRRTRNQPSVRPHDSPRTMQKFRRAVNQI